MSNLPSDHLASFYSTRPLSLYLFPCTTVFVRRIRGKSSIASFLLSPCSSPRVTRCGWSLRKASTTAREGRITSRRVRKASLNSTDPPMALRAGGEMRGRQRNICRIRKGNGRKVHTPRVFEICVKSAFAQTNTQSRRLHVKSRLLTEHRLKLML